MGRGIDTTLDWPVVKQLTNGSWLVDTGARLNIRQRKRFDLKKDADDFAKSISDGHKIDGKSFLSEQQRNEYRLAVSTLGEQYKTHSLVDVVEYFLRTKGLVAVSPNVSKACIAFRKSRGEKFDAKEETNEKTDRYIFQLRTVLGEFAEKFGERHVAEITSSELNQFLTGPRANKRNPSKQIKPTTRNNIRRVIAAFYNYCLKQKWILENPMSYVDEAAKVVLNPQILTIDNTKKLLEFVAEKHADMLGFFALSLFCGIRVQELCRLRVSDLMLESHDGKYSVLIDPDVAKTGRPRNVAIPYNCFVWINHWLKQARIPVGPNQWRKKRALKESDRIVPVAEASVFYRTALIAKESGIVLPQNVLRHSFASYYYETTLDAEQTRSRLGHETDVMLFRHYRQLIKRGGLGSRHPVEYFKLLPGKLTWKDVMKDKADVLKANNTDTFRLLNLL